MHWPGAWPPEDTKIAPSLRRRQATLVGGAICLPKVVSRSPLTIMQLAMRAADALARRLAPEDTKIAPSPRRRQATLVGGAICLPKVVSRSLRLATMGKPMICCRR
jgi:hypothetical protein